MISDDWTVNFHLRTAFKQRVRMEALITSGKLRPEYLAERLARIAAADADFLETLRTRPHAEV